MPENTAMPIAWRISEPEPVDSTSGTTYLLVATYSAYSASVSEDRLAHGLSVRLLLDPAYGRIYDQVLEFLGADDSFLSRPAEASSTVPRIASASTDAPGTAHQNATP